MEVFDKFGNKVGDLNKGGGTCLGTILGFGVLIFVFVVVFPKIINRDQQNQQSKGNHSEALYVKDLKVDSTNVEVKYLVKYSGENGEFSHILEFKKAVSRKESFLKVIPTPSNFFVYIQVYSGNKYLELPLNYGKNKKAKDAFRKLQSNNIIYDIIRNEERKYWYNRIFN